MANLQPPKKQKVCKGTVFLAKILGAKRPKISRNFFWTPREKSPRGLLELFELLNFFYGKRSRSSKVQKVQEVQKFKKFRFHFLNSFLWEKSSKSSGFTSWIFGRGENKVQKFQGHSWIFPVQEVSKLEGWIVFQVDNHKQKTNRNRQTNVADTLTFEARQRTAKRRIKQ